jgi:mannose-6-phosphate isomerase-like protein (cupin superfamily)
MIRERPVRLLKPERAGNHGSACREAGVGEALEIGPGCAHRFFNGGAADVRFLVISAPTTRGDRAAAPDLAA